MTFGITNKAINLPPHFSAVEASTSQMQFVSTATSTNAGAYQHWELADYTTTGPIPLQGQVVTGSIGDFGAAYRTFRAFVHFKSLVEGTNTSTGTVGGPLVTLEVATSTSAWVGGGSTGSTKGATVIASQVLYGTGATSTGGNATMFLFGQTPLVAGAQFARINFYPIGASLYSQTSSTAVDVIIEAV